MIKTQLHIHVKGDPVDAITHDWKTLIDHAHKKNFQILAFTCHKRIVFPLKAKKYANRLGILLIKGVEINVNKKHVLILNPAKAAERIHTFKDLEKYKSGNPQSLIIAPHPFHPGKISLHKDLHRNIGLFDALEQSFYYTKLINPNLRTQSIAKKHGIPLIGTSDCHILEYFDRTHSTLNISPPLTTKKVFDAIKKNNLSITGTPLSNTEAAKIMTILFLQKLRKKFSVI